MRERNEISGGSFLRTCLSNTVLFPLILRNWLEFEGLGVN